MQLIYDGTLSKQTLDYITGMLKDYPFVVEVDRDNMDFAAFNEWRDLNFPEYVTHHEDCMGKGYTREQTLYGVVGNFFLFKSQAEKDMFVLEYGASVICIDPFKTVIQDYQQESFLSRLKRSVAILFPAYGLQSPKS